VGFNEFGVVMLMLASFTGGLALIVASWQPAHDCGNRFCPHRTKRVDESDREES
jgi:hypothetical protein